MLFNIKVLGPGCINCERVFQAVAATLEELEAGNQVVFRYSTPRGKITERANPNGSLHNIAGIVNKQGNVLGMMPHPERACEPLLGSADGNLIWESIIEYLQRNSG